MQYIIYCWVLYIFILFISITDKLDNILLTLYYPGGTVIKNLPVMQKIQKTRVWSLGWEDPLEKEMATHSNILAWEILWTEESGGLQSIGLERVGHNWATEHTHILLICY